MAKASSPYIMPSSSGVLYISRVEVTGLKELTVRMVLPSATRCMPSGR